MSKKIQVILLQNVAGYGNKWTLVEVSVPYAKNVMIPKWLAKIADSQTLNSIQQAQQKKQKDEEKRATNLNLIFDRINQQWWLVIARQATEQNKLYDKIDAKDIAGHFLQKFKMKISKDSVKLDWKLEELGEYLIQIEIDWVKRDIKLIVQRK